MLTVQTCAGVPLTAVTIKLLLLLVDLVTWRYAFMVLEIGPFVGVVCMLRLRQHSDAEKLACGRRSVFSFYVIIMALPLEYWKLKRF